MGSLGTQFVHDVRQFVGRVAECKDEVTAAVMERTHAQAAKNEPFVAAAEQRFRDALHALQAFTRDRAVFGEKGLPPAETKRLQRLVAAEGLADAASCALSGVSIQRWEEGEGTPRFVCQDAAHRTRTVEAHSAVVAVLEKVRPHTAVVLVDAVRVSLLSVCNRQVASMSAYSGVVDTCMAELR